jgi:hypothetical protein
MEASRMTVEAEVVAKAPESRLRHSTRSAGAGEDPLGLAKEFPGMLDHGAGFFGSDQSIDAIIALDAQVKGIEQPAMKPRVQHARTHEMLTESGVDRAVFSKLKAAFE